jgi:cytochrome c oxidase cbb3-type subunit I
MAASTTSLKEVDASSRVPLFVLFVSAAVWLVIASLFSLIASIKFHSPGFLAACPWLTYGRIHPVATNALLYGFALQAGLGVALWIFTRLGGNEVVQPWLIAVGAKIWNLGVTLGLIAILLGHSTGFENFEMPRQTGIILLLGYLMIGVWALVTLHQRQDTPLGPSQWFLLAALLWFPWIFCTGHVLLTVAPVRGMTQAVVNWWYSANLTTVWMGLVGLAAIFYFLPRLVGRALYSETLALFTFWTLILFGSWTGIPASAPLPAWIPSLSTVATVMALTMVASVMLNVYKTVGYGCGQTENPPSGKFIAFGAMAFVVSWLMNIANAVPPVSSVTNLTWFTTAQSHLNSYGFFAMTLFGAIYYIVPQVTGMEWPSAKSVRAHYWLAAAGILLLVVPLAVGGVWQGVRLNDPKVSFPDITRSTLMFLRVATLGELCLLAGHLLLLNNIVRLTVRYARAHWLPVVIEFKAAPKPAEVKP